MDARTTAVLINTGVMDAERVTAKPSSRHCKACRRVVLAALADDGPAVTGYRVTLDPRPLTASGELHALLAGLGTFAHHGGGITWRDPASIKRANADDRKVHHEHSCHPPPLEYKKPPRQETPPLPTTEIPF